MVVIRFEDISRAAAAIAQYEKLTYEVLKTNREVYAVVQCRSGAAQLILQHKFAVKEVNWGED